MFNFTNVLAIFIQRICRKYIVVVFCATPSGFRWMLTAVLQGLMPLPKIFHPFGVGNVQYFIQ